VAGFPQTYQIVRQGAVTPVTVRNDDEVVSLRTELELLSDFAKDATPEIVEALEARLAALQSSNAEGSRRVASDIEDMLGILRDAMNPAAAEVIARIDADFPQARGSIDMASIEKESGGFHEDVARQVSASGKPAASRLGQSFKQALLKSAVAAKEAALDSTQPADTPPPTTVGERGAPADQQAQSTGTSPAGSVDAAAPVPGPDPVEAALEQAVNGAEGSPVSGSAAEVEVALEADEETLAALGDEQAVEAEEVIEAEEEEWTEAEETAEAESLAEMAELAEELEGEDPVEAALAEAFETAAEVDGQGGDPVEAILAEQAAAGESAATAAAAERLLAGQPTGAAGEISPGQLADVLLVGRIDATPTAEEVEDSIKKELVEAVQAADASPPTLERGGVEAERKHAEKQAERGKPDANSNPSVVSQDDADGAEVAAEKVAKVISDTQDEVEAIASAFEEATSDLGAIESEVCDVAGGENDSLLPGVDMTDYVEPTGGLTNAATDGAASAESAFNLPSLNLRGELQAIRQNLQGGLERLIRLLDRVDQIHVEAENRLSKARNYQLAAQKAHEVSEMLVQAQTDAAEAKATFESAQRRLDEARSAWDEARRSAEAAAF